MKLSVDIPFALLLFAFALSDPVTTNFVVYRTCYVTMGFNKSDCALLGTPEATDETAKLELKVQPHAAVLTTTKSVTEIVVTSIWCFFLGPWSDQYGRRPVMIMSLAGFVCAYAIITAISLFEMLSPWFLLLASIPICLTGGFPSFLAVSICHLTETTHIVKRGFRMGIFEAVITIAGLLGATASSFVFHAYGYFTLYYITASCIVTAWIIVMIFVQESNPNPETEGRCRNLFKFSLIKDTVKTTFEERPGLDRPLLLSVILMTVIFLLAVTADGNIVFLYLRRKLSWTLRQYTLFASCRKISWIIGSILGGYVLHTLLKVEESVVILLGFLSVMANVLIQGLASKDWHMYVAGAVICFGGSISPMTRSLISKLVHFNECGKVFSFVIMVETIVDLLGSPIYTYIYNHTIETLPGAFNFVTTGIYGFEVVLTIGIITLQLRRFGNDNYEPINDVIDVVNT
ncbi:hypothetical protein PPYR_01680 [Photinus pyralis]|uniref:Major facilitator superfamily (MFS) profile domain-containing protein n=3 Tax=Photinus pyralis TaxID=7054 RepID=A0A1Y1L2R4_PHOPY|nr:proton-coupled folate transporter-like [Photinus pyralis]KAB0804710.1 hypothetical protein PPYR_01680 [Photinus pyralis]